MPPVLALLLCTAFVIFLLRVERKQSPDVSPALWIPTLWMLAISSKPLGVWFSTGGTAEDGSPLDRIFLSGLCAAGILVLIRRRFDFARSLRENQWLLLLLGYMLLSTLWSDITSIAIKRWIRHAIVVIMAFVILSESNPRQALGTLLRRTFYILMPFSILLIKYYPALGVDYGRWSGLQMWIGVTLHKNTLGRLCLIAAFFLLWSLYRCWRDGKSHYERRRLLSDFSVLLMALFLLKGADNAYSATSIVTFATGVSAFLGLAWLHKRRIGLPQPVALGFLVFLMGFGTATPFLGGSNLASFTSSVGRDETLTGRTETWAELVPVVKREPFLGLGYGSFWTTARREYYQMSHGHNGYLDTLLELGFLGLALYALYLLSCGSRFCTALAQNPDWASFGLCMLLMNIIYNYSESSINSLSEQMTGTLIILSIVLSARTLKQAASMPEFATESPAAASFTR